MTYAGIGHAQSVEPLSPQDIQGLRAGLANCEARVSSDALSLVHIPSGGRAAFRYGGRLIDASIVLQGSGKSGPEVHFTWTEDGDNVTGVLQSLGKGEPCGPSGACRVVPAKLKIVSTSRRGSIKTVLDRAVTVRDTCAEDAQRRLFQSTSWLEKLFRWGAVH